MIRVADRLFPFVMAALVGSLSLDANGAAVTSTYCFQYALSLTDGAVGDKVTGSYDAARGVFVEFVRESDSVVINDGYVSESTGCVVLDNTGGSTKLDDQTEYTIKVHRTAVVNGNTVEARSGAGNQQIYIAAQNFTPYAHTYSYANGDTWTRLLANDATHIMAVATAALSDHAAGLSGETFTFWDAACPGSSPDSCFEQSTEILWIGSPDRKYSIATILGLAIAGFTNDHDGVSKNSGAALDACVPTAATTGVLMNTKEYQSAAIYHALGSYYAALTFNFQFAFNDDCEFSVEQDVNWNADNDFSDTDEDRIFACSDNPAPGLSPVVWDESYFDETCGSSGTNGNRATQFDWLGALWDIDIQTASYTPGQIFQVWDAANPDTWNASGDTCCLASNYPARRLQDAASSDPDWSDWTTQNGCYH